MAVAQEVENVMVESTLLLLKMVIQGRVATNILLQDLAGKTETEADTSRVMLRVVLVGYQTVKGHSPVRQN